MAMPDRDGKFYTNDDGEEVSKPMKNMAGIMKKVQDMQGRLRVMQEELAIMKFTAVVGGGAVPCAQRSPEMANW